MKPKRHGVPRVGYKQLAIAIAQYLEDHDVDVGRKHVWFAGKKNSADPRALKRVVDCSSSRTHFDEGVACRISISSAPFPKGKRYDVDEDPSNEENTAWGNVTVYHPSLEVVVEVYEPEQSYMRAAARDFKERVERLIRDVTM